MENPPKSEVIEVVEEPLFDIVAFNVPHHKSLIYRQRQTSTELQAAILRAIAKGANVMSIRLVVD